MATGVDTSEWDCPVELDELEEKIVDEETPCDVCGDDLPVGTTFYGNEEAEWDVCEFCYNGLDKSDPRLKLEGTLRVGDSGAGTGFDYSVEGWYITAVEDEPGQPDLQMGDLIVAIGGESLRGRPQEEQVAAFRKHYGDGAKLTILRELKNQTAAAEIAAYEALAKQERRDRKKKKKAKKKAAREPSAMDVLQEKYSVGSRCYAYYEVLGKKSSEPGIGTVVEINEDASIKVRLDMGRVIDSHPDWVRLWTDEDYKEEKKGDSLVLRKAGKMVDWTERLNMADDPLLEANMVFCQGQGSQYVLHQMKQMKKKKEQRAAKMAAQNEFKYV